MEIWNWRGQASIPNFGPGAGPRGCQASGPSRLGHLRFRGLGLIGFRVQAFRVQGLRVWRIFRVSG